jgi:hypothetical protein
MIDPNVRDRAHGAHADADAQRCLLRRGKSRAMRFVACDSRSVRLA